MNHALNQTILNFPNIAVICVRVMLALAGVAWLGALIQDYPVGQVLISAFLVIYAVVLAIYPRIWLIVVPALLPILDLTPWSGRVLLGAFDFVIMATFLVALASGRLSFGLGRFSYLFVVLLTCLVISYLSSFLRGYYALPAPNEVPFEVYHSSLNSIRVAKGFAGALLLLPVLAWAMRDKKNTQRLFSIGMTVGFSVCALVILWERMMFIGLFDTATNYRVSGMFSGMLLGGAFVDAFLVLSFPFCLVWLQAHQPVWARILGVGLLLVSIYVFYVTYTRTTYLAWLVIVGGFLAMNRFYIDLRKIDTHLLQGAGALAVVILIGVLMSGSFIKERFSTTYDDLLHRFDHWGLSIDIADDSASARLLGMGTGTFPHTYFDRTLDGVHMSRFWLAEDDNKRFIRYSASGNSGGLYLRQRLNLEESGQYRVAIQLRHQAEKQQKLLVEFCERNILKYKVECTWRGFKVNPSEDGKWTVVNQKVNLDAYVRHSLSSIRPVDIALMNRGLRDTLEIGKVEMYAPSGRQIILNADFSEGMDHWVFSSENHLAWHIKNLWVSAYFEAGLLGVSIICMYILWLLLKCSRLRQLQLPIAPALAAAIAGFCVIAAFGSIFDEPRISLLFFLVSWMVALSYQKRNGPRGETTP